MDVRLPDGTVLRGVPDGTTKAQIVEKLQANGMQVPQEWLTQRQQKPIEQMRAELDAYNEHEASFGGRLSRWAIGPGAEILRGVGRLGKNTVQGAMALPTMVADIPGQLFNAGASIAGSDTRAPLFMESMNALGGEALAPRGAAERFEDRITQGVAGTMTGIGVGRALVSTAAPVASRVGEVLSANPGAQVVAAGTGASSSQLAQEMGAGPVGQAVAGVVGGSVPYLAQAGVRGALRGGEQGRRTIEQNVAAFERAGTTPTVGQATERRFGRATETALSRSPGSAGVMVKSAEKQAAQVGGRLEQLAESLSPVRDSSGAGRAIVGGVTKQGGFLDTFKASSSANYDALGKLIPKNARIDVTNTVKALHDMAARIQGATNLSGALVNPKIAAWRDALDADLLANSKGGQAALLQPNGNGLPYGALKAVRTLVGNELADAPFGGDIPTAQLKRVYAAMSADMEAAAKAAGPDAVKALSRANSYHKAGMARLEQISSVIEKNGGPEAVFRAATSGTKEGATVLNAVMKSLPEDGRKAVSASVIRRLGRATAGAQNDSGDLFSMGTFLTNWNNLSKQAKAVLFNRYGEKFTADMDAIAKVASNIRDGSKVYANPSGTAAAGSQLAGGAAFVTALSTGNVKTALGIAAGAGAANVMARRMTNPRFVAWLAMTTKAPASALPSIVASAAASNDPDIREAAEVLKAHGYE